MARYTPTKRTAISEEKPFTFDMGTDDYQGYLFRIKIDHNGITFWRKATSNLDEPRKMDKYLHLSWGTAAEAAYAYIGSKTGHQPKGPANSLCGLGYLVRKAK